MLTKDGDELWQCDNCEGLFEPDEIHQHEDGNQYCDACNYATPEDRMDGEADDSRDEI